MDSVEKVFKIVIIGNPSVGKSSLRRTYLGERFPTNYLKTIGADFSFKNLKIDGETFGLALWDLAGQPQFEAVHPFYYKGAVGAIVVYCIDNKESFDDVVNWIERFYSSTKNNTAPLLLIGNKIDLIPDLDHLYITEQNQQAKVEEFSNKYSEIFSITSIRTSAKTGENVEKGINRFGSEILKWVIEKTQISSESVGISTNIEENFPAAYLLTMNQISGPKIIARSPNSDDSSTDSEILSNSVVKLVASLDFEDIITHSTVTGTFPWVKPFGIVYYIAFVFENLEARGKKELFVVGINANRALEEAITGLKGIFDGFLHGSLNEFYKIRTMYKTDFVTKAFMKKDHSEVISEVEKMLLDLRTKINESLIKWYNV